MSRFHVGLIASCAAIVGCGGNDSSSRSNAAASKTFTYGPATAASPTEKSTVQRPVSAAVSFGGSAGGALALASFSGTSSALLGDSGTAFLRSDRTAPELQQGLPRRDQLTANCVQVNGNTYTYKNCQFTVLEGDFRGTATLDGTISISSDQKTVNWDLSIGVILSGSGFNENVQAHESGFVTVANNRMTGDLRVETSVPSTTGTTGSFALDEEIVFDLSYQTSPFCVISGSFEAKRVWTRQPAQAQPDKGVKLVFTGCNQATIAGSL